VELEPQVLGNETDGCVFGGSNLVSHELRSRMTFFVARILGQWHVEEDTATSDSSGTDSRSVPLDSRLVESSVERFLFERRLRMDWRFVPPCEPVTLCVAQRNRFAGAVS
jgi:hypothetical protein